MQQYYGKNSNWMELIRQFLISNDPDLIDLAIEKLQKQRDEIKKAHPLKRLIIGEYNKSSVNLEIISLLRLWQKNDLHNVLEKAASIVKKLYLQKYREEMLTIALLHDEVVIQQAEGYLISSEANQIQIFENGLNACISCLNAARELNDKDLIAKFLVRHGNGLFSALKLEESIKNFEEALTILYELESQKPKKYLSEIAEALRHLANVYTKSNQIVKAYPIIKKSLLIYQKLIQINQNNYKYQLDYASSLNSFGILNQITNQLDIALEVSNKSLSIFRSLATEDNAIKGGYNLSSLLLDMSRLLCNLGNINLSLDGIDRINEAKNNFEEAISIQINLSSVFDTKVKLANSKIGIGRVFYKLGLDKDNFIELFEKAKKQFQEALDLQPQYIMEKVAVDINSRVETLINLALIHGRLKEIIQARKLLKNAVEICEKHQLHLFLALAYETYRDIERWNSCDFLIEFNFAEKAVKSLELGLSKLSQSESINFNLYKSKIEVSYALCIAHYANNNDADKVFHLLESLRSIDTLSKSPFVKHDLTEAKRIVNIFDIAYLAIQVVPGGMVFFAILPTGKVIIRSISKDWRGKFFLFFEDIHDTINELSKIIDNSFMDSLNNKTKELRDSGKNLFNMLPDDIKIIFETTKQVFLSPYGELHNLPFEFLYLPTDEWLGLKQLLPRIYSFKEFESVLNRQPSKHSYASIVIGDPRNDLKGAKATAFYVAEKLKKNGLHLINSGIPTVGEQVNKEAFLNGFNSSIVFGLYIGHGGKDSIGGFLALSGKDKIRPGDIESLSFDQNPIIHYDCCIAGIENYQWGGAYRSLAAITLSCGASCCLQANHYLFDRFSKNSELLYNKILDDKQNVGHALLETRNMLAENCNSPLCWAFPVLYGNPNVNLM